jgi:hypothetical protein
MNIIQLNGRQRERLHDALLGAFRDSDLSRLVSFSLDGNYDQVAPVGGNLSDRVFALIRWAEAQGKVKDLLAAVRKERPGRTDIRDLCDELERQPPVVGDAGGGAAVATGTTGHAGNVAANAGGGAAGEALPDAVQFVEALCGREEGEFDTVVTGLGISRADIGGGDQRARANNVYRRAQRGKKLGLLRTLILKFNPGAFD